LIISNHNSFRVLFDEIAYVYCIWKIYFYFSIGIGQLREPALCQLYRHTFVPYAYADCRPWQIQWVSLCAGGDASCRYHYCSDLSMFSLKFCKKHGYASNSGRFLNIKYWLKTLQSANLTNHNTAHCDTNTAILVLLSLARHHSRSRSTIQWSISDAFNGNFVWGSAETNLTAKKHAKEMWIQWHETWSCHRHFNLSLSTFKRHLQTYPPLTSILSAFEISIKAHHRFTVHMRSA